MPGWNRLASVLPMASMPMPSMGTSTADFTSADFAPNKRIEFLRLQTAAQRFGALQEFLERRPLSGLARFGDEPFGCRQILRRFAEQRKPDEFGVEIFRESGDDAAHGIAERFFAHQRDGQRMHAHDELFVVRGHLDELVQTTVQLLVFIAQHFELIARERCRRALLARHDQRERDVGKLAQETRCRRR